MAAMRSLATRMLTPAASALRRCPGPGVPPPPRSPTLGIFGGQHNDRIPKASAQEMANLMEEMDKVGKAFRQRDKEVKELTNELMKVTL